MIHSIYQRGDHIGIMYNYVKKFFQAKSQVKIIPESTTPSPPPDFISFKLPCWRRLLRVPWTARRTNKSILKETNPEYSLEGLRLKLKLQHFSDLMQRTDLLEKTLMLGRIEGRRRRWQQRMRWLDGITES